jgi:hypothetical protein
VTAFKLLLKVFKYPLNGCISPEVPLKKFPLEKLIRLLYKYLRFTDPRNVV